MATTTDSSAAQARTGVGTAPVDDHRGVELEVDEGDNDSAFADDDDASETTSLASSLIRGHIENGRKYATMRDDYWGPSDEKQFEVMDAGHFMHLVLLSDRDNMLYCSPTENPRRILDIGTGSGTWAVDTADKFPEATVYGADIFPPPMSWVPPNCLLEVEDVTRDWTWQAKFDLIHVRYMNGAFTPQEWTDLYQKAYDNLNPGGWIEQIEPSCMILSDDGTLDPKSHLANLGQTFFDCAEKAGRSVKIIDTMKKSIKDAGFTNVQESYIKLPIGAWPKEKKLKEAGRISQRMWADGMEGFLMFLLTKFGSPRVWEKDEVVVYAAKLREELKNPKLHSYHYVRRVWAQKPL